MGRENRADPTEPDSSAAGEPAAVATDRLAVEAVHHGQAVVPGRQGLGDDVPRLGDSEALRMKIAGQSVTSSAAEW